MKIFVIGLPVSGKTTFAKEISEQMGYIYIDATSWLKNTFRDKQDKETECQYQEMYHQYLTDRLKKDHNIFSRNIVDIISLNPNHNFIIEGSLNPTDFNCLFDYNQDMIIILNRNNNESEFLDYENIGLSVIRDYCYWMSSFNLINKEQWIEYNFKIPGEDNDFIKALGSKNTIYIVRSLNKAINYTIELLKS